MPEPRPDTPLPLTEKGRLHRALTGRTNDRPSVIIPGGMMSFLTSELLRENGLDGARVTREAEPMALASEIARETLGLENLGVPFCLTVEAEALGATVSPGSTSVEPVVIQPALPSAADLPALRLPEPEHDRRMVEVLAAIETLHRAYPDVPVVGNLSGPATLAGGIVPIEEFLKLLCRRNSLAEAIIEVATETLICFGEAMVRHGADVICVSDPNATGEIIGPGLFADYFLPQYQRIFQRLRAQGAGTILHICGDVTRTLPLLGQAQADAVSLDSFASVNTIRQELDSSPLMGNVSTLLLSRGEPEAIERAVLRVLRDGVDIVAPSCGLDRSTPSINVQRMCRTVKRFAASGPQ
jgi:MtaA/CmuA family methyltransferase